jgi:type 1 glutamine amidotransferase
MKIHPALAGFVLWLLATLTCLAGPVRVLILTGANNHDWRATTPVLKQILEDGGRFAVDVETNVAGMKPEAFGHYDALVSNFNTFGGEKLGEVWNPEMRAAFVKFIREGHGFVVVHAGSALFYDWPEFQQIAGATWGKTTSHGRMHTNEIHLVAPDHPVTAGLKDFQTFDEFWQNAPVSPGATALATVTPKKEFGGTGKPEPIALATELGGGRGFTLLLGHNVRTMDSDGFKALLRRGTEWAATGKVSTN